MEDQLNNSDFKVNKAPKGFGVRHLQALLLLFSLSVVYTTRIHLSVSMVAMTTTKVDKCDLNTNSTNNSEVIENCTSLNTNEVTNISMWNVYRTYNWDKKTQEMIMYAFFVGYTGMMIPMGIVSQKFGGKLPILIALGVNGVLSILTPWLPIFGGWIIVCACRLLQGMTQACMYPSMHTMLAQWAPISERGRLSTYVYTGSQIGTVVSFTLSGLLAGSPSLGWPSTFWVFGTASLICFGLVWWLGASSPHDYLNISSEEFAYIVGNEDSNTMRRKVPWKQILTSKAVWALITTHTGSNLYYLMLLTQIPTYMSNVLGVNIKKNGLYSSLPYLMLYVMVISFGHLSDYLRNNKIMSLINIRRTANSIGMAIPAVFMIAFGYVNNTTVAVILLVLCLGTHCGIFVGFHINHIDLAPNFAGSIMAVGNMIGNLMSLLVPVIVVSIVKEDLKNQQRWQIVFITFGLLLIITNAVFVVFVKADTQDWNYYGDKDATSHQYSMIRKKSETVKQENIKDIN